MSVLAPPRGFRSTGCNATGVAPRALRVRAASCRRLAGWLALLPALCAAGVPSAARAAAGAVAATVPMTAAAAAGAAGATTSFVPGVPLAPRAPKQPAVPSAPCDWPLWNSFANTGMQADGRVIDFSTPEQQTTSEGQSYAMFFALVDNDRPSFDRVLNWSTANLGSGDLSSRLPAWQWGKRKDGSFGVIDQNSASDADLWFAYSLFEAGRLWHEPRYTKLAQALQAQIEDREMFELPGFGPMLAPAQDGFKVAADLWRLNPSYMPLPVVRLLALNAKGSAPLWQKVAANTVKLIAATAPKGFAPDWIGYQTGKGFVVDTVKGDVGSYDAIRVYLWAGLTARGDPLARPLLDALGGMRNAVQASGMPPEKVATVAGVPSGQAPPGFSAALLPYLKAAGDPTLVSVQQGRIADLLAHGAKQTYYDNVLMLFGQGWNDGRYRFDAQGRLMPRWETSCHTANAR